MVKEKSSNKHTDFPKIVYFASTKFLHFDSKSTLTSAKVFDQEISKIQTIVSITESISDFDSLYITVDSLQLVQVFIFEWYKLIS